MQNNDATQKLKTLIKDIQFAMLTTRHADETLHSRPMAGVQFEDNGTIWFFTGKHSGKVHEIQEDQQVNLAYSEPSKSEYVSVSGRASLVEDKAKAAELWNPMYRAWFPKGLEDPELALLKVEIDTAEYWDSHSSKLVHLVGFAKAILTGQPYKAGPQEHNRVEM